MTTSLSLHDVHFRWPDGTTVLDGLDLAVGPGRHGLVGRGGAGKSTLLRLLTGDLTPSAGTVTINGTLAHLPQDLGVDPGRTVGEELGVAGTIVALRRVEAGSGTATDLDVVGDDWGVEARAEVELARLGLDHLGLERPVGSVSGGELVLLSLASRLLTRPTVLLLDEPTNSLDGDARERLSAAVATWRGTLLVVSHDRALLNTMDDIGELRGGSVSWHGGGYDAYEAAVAAEQEVAARAVRSAESDVREQRRGLIAAQTVIARRARYGQRMNDQKREPKIVMGQRKRSAQESAAHLRGVHEDRLDGAGARLAAAEELVRDDREINIDLSGTHVPPGRVVLVLDDVHPPFGDLVVDLELRGPERVALTGRNGTGKSSLLRTITGDLTPTYGTADARVPVGFLPQGADLLEPGLTVAENVARIAPASTENQRRAQLARFLLRGRAADRLASTQSGASGCGPTSRASCSPIRHHSCSCWTSRPTISTSRAPATSSRPCGRTKELSSS